MLTVGYVQYSPVFGKKEENLNRVSLLCRTIKADLLVLPELFATGYAFESSAEAVEMAEEPKGMTSEALRQISYETGAVCIAGFPEKGPEGAYNSALAVNSTGVIQVYRKIHLFNREKEYFLPGNTPFPVIPVKGIPVGIMICFDWIFPESARTLAMKGALIIAHPSNLVLPFCQKAMITRSIENKVFTVTSNRTGREDRGGTDLLFTGQSQITDPSGRLLAQAGEDSEEVHVVSIDPGLALDKKPTPFNDVFLDRRPEMYKF